jgi:PhzF family phenazine biosynthesis protein
MRGYAQVAALHPNRSQVEMDLTVGLVDVFADEPLTGNPLAVVEDADDLTLDQMKRIAAEFNQAETTFIMQSARADRKLRSFTAAGSEVVGAGHNALGAWLWLAELGKLGPLDAPQTFHQEIGEEVLPIILTKIGGRIHGRMRQSPYGF